MGGCKGEEKQQHWWKKGVLENEEMSEEQIDREKGNSVLGVNKEGKKNHRMSEEEEEKYS